MQGKNGLQVLKDIKKINSSLPVLILSMYPEEQYAIRAIKSGASGYLTKDSASEELLTAINHILNGHKYITSSLAEKLANKLSVKDIEFPHKELTDREFEVFKRLAVGNTLTEIAQDLELSVKTISTYKIRILEKMKVESRTEITAYAIKNKLMD